MKHSPVKFMVILFMLLSIVSLFASELQAQVNSYTVEEFMKKKSEWRGLKDNIKVEGRVSTFTATSLQFININNEVSFKWASPDLKPPKLYGNAEIYGKLELQVSKWIFTIQRIEEKPSDFDYIKRKVSGLNEEKPEPWIELAKWAEERAVYYSNDSVLLSKSQELKEKAIAIIRKKITKNDPEEILKLAAQVKQLGLDNFLYEEYLHEGLYYKYHSISKLTGGLPDFSRVLQHELPGSLQPLKDPDARLVASYEKDPLAAYKAGTPANRRLFERLFYKHVILKYIESLASSDFSMSKLQAEKLKEFLPDEELQLYEKFLEQDLHYRSEGIGTRTRQEAIDLSQEYIKRNQVEQGKKLLEKWMQARKARIANDRLQDRLDLADDYIALLGQNDKAREELISASVSFPDSRLIAERLEKLDYVFSNGKWIPKNSATNNNTTSMPLNITHPGLKEGMTRDQVFAEIGGPTSITRSFSQAGMIEIWDYSDHHLSITFVASKQNPLLVKETINTNPAKEQR